MRALTVKLAPTSLMEWTTSRHLSKSDEDASGYTADSIPCTAAPSPNSHITSNEYIHPQVYTRKYMPKDTPIKQSLIYQYQSKTDDICNRVLVEFGTLAFDSCTSTVNQRLGCQITMRKSGNQVSLGNPYIRKSHL